MRKKRQSSQQCHLALLGRTSVKAAHKTLVKLTRSHAKGDRINESDIHVSVTFVCTHNRQIIKHALISKTIIVVVVVADVVF
jgi:hypothetical protein